MSSHAGSMWRRSAGFRTVVLSAVLGAAGVTPLLLYIALGPVDGNPIGLGLLAAVSVPAGLCGVAAGAVRLVVEYLTRNRE